MNNELEYFNQIIDDYNNVVNNKKENRKDLIKAVFQGLIATILLGSIIFCTVKLLLM
jgi:hypothetical protein